jgi:flagellar basal-body rod modification protein FlgD
MTTTAPATSTPAATAASATSANGAQSSSSALNQLSGNFDTFLSLLTTQLKNQDPTSPMDSNQFTSELVQFSQVEQQINTNTNLNTLITQGQSQIGAYATSYLGKAVSITNGNASLTNGAASWSYTLGTTAAQTTLTVSNASGNVVFTGPGQTSAGTSQFNWNGQDNNGNQLPDGTYKLAVTANAADGSGVTTTIASAGVVSEIDMTSGTPQLVIGNMEVGLGSIANVAN